VENIGTDLKRQKTDDREQMTDDRGRKLGGWEDKEIRRSEDRKIRG
jgi:hypothetical protein